MIREAETVDLDKLLELYLHLHEKEIPAFEKAYSVWSEMMRDEHHHVIIYERDGKFFSSCICVIVPNLTRNVRPYALIENVVTHKDYRGKGYASLCLAYAKELALRHDCYKIMLMTGSKERSVLDFYKRAGFNSEDKTAFIQKL